MVVGHKAVARIVSQSLSVSDTMLSETLAPGEAESTLTGQVFCPRGCGTRIFWALSADLAEYKEAFLIYLNQQLSWTACPDHKTIQPQGDCDDEMIRACLPSAASVVGGGPRYVNRYE